MFAPWAYADKEKQNTYKVSNNDILVQTRYCYVYACYEQEIIKKMDVPVS